MNILSEKLHVHTILAGIKACDRCSQHFNKVTHAPQVLVHVPEVGVDVVAVPINQEKYPPWTQKIYRKIKLIDTHIHTSQGGRSSSWGCPGESSPVDSVGCDTGPTAPFYCEEGWEQFLP